MTRKKIRVSIGRKKDLQQPDEVMSALQGTYSTIEKYRYLIIAAIAVVLVVVLAVSGWVSWRASRRQETTESFFKVFEIRAAEVKAPGEESEEAAEGTYPTEAAKYEALAEAVSTFIDEEASGPIEDAARLVLVGAYAHLDRSDEAIRELEAFLDSEGETTLKPIVLENLGTLKVRAGDPEAAAGHFREMESVATVPYFKARALMHLGDLANPALPSAKGEKDAAAARELYGKALELLPEEEEQGPLPSLTSLARHDVQVRLLLTPGT
ncbi:MAG: tetratricopeptide repeat protein [Deltaproteobacteria bacterium]|nr:tetratricopeptide repeat protein [Deltaproteobacteria bacterium]